ncbi:PAS domain S-box protein [Inquilinus sp. KBS0705]|nr:PAS domain S-box protein [Inquilinus sp. KBS0705]
MDNTAEKDTNTNNHSQKVNELKRYAIINTSNLAIEAANVGTWFLDVETNVFIPSQRMKELYGFNKEDEITYSDCMACVTDKYKKRVQQATDATLANKQNYDIEYAINCHESSKQRWIKALGALAHDSTGKIIHFSGVLIDITQQRKAEKNKFKFIGVVSHELKTPLTTLKAYVQMLNNWAKKQKDNFTMGTLSKVEKQIVKMTTMINSFLNISQAETGKIRLNLQEFNIAQLLKDAIDETRIITMSHTMDFLPGEPVIVNADKEKIEQVIINLLNNASKYSPAGTAIDVNYKKVNDTVEVCIKDQGIGIEPQNIGKLFDQYFRVENDETQKVAGFGIGLYLSAEIIHLHQGQIWVQSEFGAGSSFYFSLPVNG